ncbi:hypothetical protein [Tenuifilum thalassicum]|uniref:Uncharacterized protein n=1 Tax=Tenuifilum thalassicum TaxID=2590900 RepID=A0A7D4BDM5_9BACT|nr:hypothetical protein [Tenuifilum thalassicum]QKG79903.1 hypothetical protein FHG85_06380 [Tenuifilum thalassicum]
MKTKLLILFVLAVNFSFCQAVADYDKKIVDNYSRDEVGILEAPFMINELIEIYKKDSLIVKRIFNREVFNRTQYNLYCYNVCADFFYKKLIERRNDKNKKIIDKIISELDYDRNIVKPQIDWSRIWETCLTCPFGEYPDDRFFFFQFSIMFMGELEIKQMASDGEQWGYMLEDIKYGEFFELNKEKKYLKYVLDRRKAKYIIERWKDCDIKEMQELIAIYKSLM